MNVLDHERGGADTNGAVQDQHRIIKT